MLEAAVDPATGPEALMIIEKTMHARWLSNTYLVADREGGHAVLIDTGGPREPIVAAAERLRVTVTHVLCTHHHYDHVAHNADYRRQYGCPVCAHQDEAALLGGQVDVQLGADDELSTGDLRVRALHIPGHTTGQLAFLVNDTHVFTGDTLFRGSVGGTRAPGHGTFDELQHSVMDVLMKLPPATEVYPGHTQATTIAAEWEENPFVRAWRGLDAPGHQRCTAYGEPASLLVDAEDYDGGRKCWVEFDDGRRDVVPGSRVRRSS
ncbi:MAG: MBL fold metallo-hydrolase [Planctomycetota bacterium]